MIDRRHLFATLFGGTVAAVLAKAGAADAGALREMQFMQPDAGPPAPAPNTPGYGNGGMAPNGATQPGEAGPYRGGMMQPEPRRGMAYDDQPVRRRRHSTMN